MVANVGGVMGAIDGIRMSDTTEFMALTNITNRLVEMNVELLSIVVQLRTIMPCGHPLICASGTDEGAWDCRWCEEVARAKAMANMKASSRAGRMPK